MKVVYDVSKDSLVLTGLAFTNLLHVTRTCAVARKLIRTSLQLLICDGHSGFNLKGQKTLSLQESVYVHMVH